MDRERFDALARLLATGGSRRGTLAVLLSVTLLRQSPATLSQRRKGKGKDKGPGGVQGEGRPGAAHHKHHQRKHTQRQRRKQRRKLDRSQDSDSLAPCTVRCAGACCKPGQVCNQSVIPNRCCTPKPPATTCAGAKCGEVINNCGQVINCGGCPPRVCQTATCSASDHLCHYTTDPDGDPCVIAGGGAGVCDGGRCVAVQCHANADCTETSNTCSDGLCTCGGGPACSGPSVQCCGNTPGGACKNVLNDPNNCGECGGLCEGSVCVAVSCVGGQCHFAQAPDNSNPGGFCPGSEVCCGGACTDVHGNVDNCGTCDHQCTNPTPVCSEDGTCVACQADVQCPSGQICCNGDCVDGACRPTLCPCTHDDQCCRGLCEGGGPVDYYCCLELFESCTSNFECCTNVCESGLCG